MKITDCINILGYSYRLASSHLEFPLESIILCRTNKMSYIKCTISWNTFACFVSDKRNKHSYTKCSYTKSRISRLHYHRWNRKIHDILCFTNCSSRASILSLPQACRYATFLTARKFWKVYTISRCDKILLQSIQRLVSSLSRAA